jgi:hypothetical protein
VAVPYVAGGEAAALAPLDGACLQFEPGGWWQYEFCHEKHVRQFHVSAGGAAAPDWSLGAFVRGGAVERAAPPPLRARFDARGAPAAYYASHFFAGGQHCDENGKKRATEVQFLCCPAAAAGGIAIDSVAEVSLCRYELRVCMPSLCASAPPEDDAAAATALAAAAATPASSGSAVGDDTVDGLPRSFVLALWDAVLAERSQEYADLVSWTPTTGISHVRFGSS